jgi:adenine-specific DNA-methyltransferase
MNNIADNGPYIEGIICKLYAPKDSEDIKEGERCFYTRENALIIDTLRKYIKDNIEFSEDNSDIYVYCLVPLLIKASINNNTSGVFKGFHKNGKKGCFGGKAKNALSRILKNIRLDLPVWSDDNFRVKCYNKDINAMIIEDLPEDIDIIYLDPPYNQHPYGSNYFMLNIIALNEEPDEISKVSGIPKKWNKSNYNYKNEAVISMKKLLEDGLKKSKMLLISYNNEGIITEADWKELFKNYNVNKYEIKYDTYKGSRNLKNREDKVIEILYLVSLNQSQCSAH